MKKSITPNQIKQNNRSLIYDYIYKNRKVSQQEISYDLHLSRPTITTNLAAMENDGLIQKNGRIDTELVGRKAAAYSIVPDYRISIGMEILKKEIKMIAINLYGEQIGHTRYEITFERSSSYFKTVCDKILEFKNQLEYLKDIQNRLEEVPGILKGFYDNERSLLYMLDGYDGIKLEWNNYYCIYNRGVLIINEQ